MGGLNLTLTEFENLSLSRKHKFLEMMRLQQEKDKQKVNEINNNGR